MRIQRILAIMALAAPAVLASGNAPRLDFTLRDATGKTHTAAELSAHKATVLLFVATDCPNSNTYAPLLTRLYRDYGPRGVLFWSVYSDPADTAQKVRQHDADYSLPYPALLDPRQLLARHTGARSTPEAVILDPDGKELYRGRVDDRFVAIGKTRYAPTESDLRDALEAVLAGRPVAHPVTKVLGCAIPGVN